jgi:transcriptional regulator with XRE-family HTH domain
MAQKKPTLRYLRELAGFSQRDLALHVNMSPSTINYIEQGKRSIRAKHADRIVSIINHRFKDLGYTEIEKLTMHDIEWQIYKQSDNSLDNLIYYQNMKNKKKEK